MGRTMKKNRSGTAPSTRIWVAVLSVIFVIAIGGMLLMNTGGRQATVARIYRSGELIAEIDLSTVTNPYNFTITSDKGKNTISVRSGGISVSDADCRDSICVKQGWLETGITPIVCLPHELVIRLEKDDAAADDVFDAVAG